MISRDPIFIGINSVIGVEGSGGEDAIGAVCPVNLLDGFSRPLTRSLDSALLRSGNVMVTAISIASIAELVLEGR